MQLQKYERRASNNIAESTLNTRMSAIRQFKKYINDKEPTVEDIESWIEHLILLNDKEEIKASTIREYYRAVASYWRIIKGNDEEISHVTRWFPENDVEHGDYLDFEELQKIRAATSSPRESCFIDIMYYYARRPGEVLLLNLEDIDLEENTIMFNILKARDRSNGTVEIPKFKNTFHLRGKKDVLRATFELHPEVRKSIEKYKMIRAPREERIKIDGSYKTVQPLFTAGNGRMGYQTAYNSIKQSANRAGINKNITPKSFRHTRSTHLDWEGNDPELIARHQLVHSPATGSNVIQGYIHEREEEDVREIMVIEDE